MKRIIALFCCCFFSLPVSSDELTHVIFDLAPFGCEAKSHISPCFHNRISTHIKAHIGLELHDVVVPYPRAIQLMENGDAHLLIVLKNPRLGSEIRSLGKLYDLEFALVAAQGRTLDSLGDLDGFRVGWLRNAAIPGATRLVNVDALHIELINYDQGREMLNRNRIDFMLAPRLFLLSAFPESLIKSATQLGEESPWLGEVHMYCHTRLCETMPNTLQRFLSQMNYQDAADHLLQSFKTPTSNSDSDSYQFTPKKGTGK